MTGAAAANAFETVLDIGCRQAKGFNPDTSFGHTQVAQAIWSDFENPIPGVKRADGFEMKYWGSVVTSPEYQNSWNDTAGLIKYADGKCEAWSRLLVDVWSAQGIVGGQVWGIVPKANAYPAPAGTTFDGFAIKWQLAGQGNAAPQWAFTDHAVVKLPNAEVIFDPSYGKTYANEQAWRDGAEDKFVFQRNDGSGTEYVDHVEGTNDSTFTQL